jgi:hypothetical protein
VFVFKHVIYYNLNMLKIVQSLRIRVWVFSAIVIALAIPTLLPMHANAATTHTAEQNVKSYLYTKAFLRCIESNGSQTLSPTNLNDGMFFKWGATGSGMSANIGYLYNFGDQVGCTDSGSNSWVHNALSLWGWSSQQLGEAQCSFGATRDNLPQTITYQACINGTGNYYSQTAGTYKQRFLDSIYLKYYGENVSAAGPHSLSSAENYLYYYNTFIQGAKGKLIVDLASATSTQRDSLQQANYYKIWYIKGTTPKEAIFSADKNKTDERYINEATKVSMDAVASKLNKSGAQAYADYLIANNLQSNITSSESSSDSTTTSCAIPGIGWVVCPVLNTLASVADSSYAFIASNFLTVSPALFVNDSTADEGTKAAAKATQDAWGIFRNIANFGLVLAFTVIIFSQLTSLGISNYGVKKMLPRLIISAILINVSYYIVQGAVDLFNILGGSIYNGLKNITPQGINYGGDMSTGQGLAGIVGGVLAGTGAATVGAFALWGAFSALLPIILAAVLALLMMFFILVARQALIILLVILAPVAFLAYLLPNTESLFTKWRKTLTGLLLVYPIASLVFAASAFAAGILTAVYSGTNTESFGSYLGSIVAAGVSVIPLFVVPTLLKQSLNAIPAIGKFASGLQSKASGNIGKQIKSGYQRGDMSRSRAAKSQIRDTRRNQAYAGRAAAGGFLATGGLALTKGQKAAKQQIASRAQGAVAAEEAANLKNDISSLEYQMNQEKQTAIANGQTYDDRKVLTNIATDSTKSATQRRAAMHLAAARGYVGEVRKMQTKFETDSNDSSLTEAQRGQARESLATLRLAKDANAGGLISKAPDLIKGPSAAFSDIGGGDLVQLHSSTATAHIEHLASLRQNSLDAQTAAQQPGATQEVIDAAATAAQSYKQAVTSLNEAVIDVSKNPQLQASFGGDVGRSYLDALSQHPQLQNDLGSLAGIDPASGKIR